MLLDQASDDNLFDWSTIRVSEHASEHFREHYIFFTISTIAIALSANKVKEKWGQLTLFTHAIYLRFLTFSWRRPLPYRTQSIDLLHKSMDWFLCNNGLRHERVKQMLAQELPKC